jgi:hypothetical protein
VQRLAKNLAFERRCIRLFARRYTSTLGGGKKDVKNSGPPYHPC